MEREGVGGCVGGALEGLSVGGALEVSSEIPEGDILEVSGSLGMRYPEGL